MPSPNSCQTARSALAATKALHVEFAAAYALATQTRDRADVERAWELKMGIDASLAEFAEANKTLTVPKLVPNIFANWPSCLETLKVIELNKEFTRERIEIGGRSEDELLSSLKSGGVGLGSGVEKMLNHEDFKRSLRQSNLNISDYTNWRLKSSVDVELICLSVADLGLQENTISDEVYTRAAELGLELCPQEVGPQWCLKYSAQKIRRNIYVAMKPIIHENGIPLLFSLGIDRVDHRLWLHSDFVGPNNWLSRNSKFLFRLPHND